MATLKMKLNDFFQPARLIKPRIRAMVFGQAGTGKTRFALSFSALGRTMVLDTERSTAHYANEFNFAVAYRKTAADLEMAIGLIERAAPSEMPDTLVIDSMSVIWALMQDTKANNGDLTYRDHAKLNRWAKTLYTRLCNLDCNLIIVCREAVEYKGEGANLKAVGFKPDVDKNLAYEMDLIIRTTNEGMDVLKSRIASVPTGKRGALIANDFVAALNAAGGDHLMMERDDEALEHQIAHDEQMAWTESDARLAAFWSRWKAEVTKDEMLGALGVDGLRKFEGTEADADAIINDYVVGRETDANGLNTVVIA